MAGNLQPDMERYTSDQTLQGQHQPNHSMDMPSTGAILSHSMPSDDLNNPMNWPLHRRLYTSAIAWVCSFAVTFGATGYTVGLNGVVAEFKVSTTVAILGFALFFWGIAFAPIWVPHASERIGRSILYFSLILLYGLFTLGVAFGQSFATIAVCRFFAGLFGGPIVVLIEGTFADIWSANTTNTYYAFLAASQYIGAASGPVVLGFIVQAKDWRWTQYVTLMIILLALILTIGMPETYQREIPRRLAKRRGLPPPVQPPAGSGVTLGEMARITVITPVVQIFTEPIVFMCALYLGFNFAVVFQWFITVPAVLNMVYGFTPGHVGLAFIAPIVGAILAAIVSIAIEQVFYQRSLRSSEKGATKIELRLIPAMYGGFLILASLFWIGGTAAPTVRPIVPIIGTGVYVWGNMAVLASLIPYIFDAFLPAGTLSALTAMAVFRLLMAGLIPLFILQDFTNLTGKWALYTFGFITIIMIPIPFILFKFGPALRARSRYSKPTATEEKAMAMMMEAQQKPHSNGNGNGMNGM